VRGGNASEASVRIRIFADPLTNAASRRRETADGHSPTVRGYRRILCRNKVIIDWPAYLFPPSPALQAEHGVEIAFPVPLTVLPPRLHGSG